MNLLFEDMIRVERGGLVCRIWREHSTDGYASLMRVADELMSQTYADCKEIAESLVGRHGVNSVEVVDCATGCGVCVHKDWP